MANGSGQHHSLRLMHQNCVETLQTCKTIESRKSIIIIIIIIIIIKPIINSSSGKSMT